MPNLTPLVVEFGAEPTIVRGALEATIGPIPELEPLASISALTPDMLAAPFDGGLHLIYVDGFSAHHYLEQMRATAALYLEAKRREAIARNTLNGHGCDPADHDWKPAGTRDEIKAWPGNVITRGPVVAIQVCNVPGCDAVREIEL